MRGELAFQAKDMSFCVAVLILAWGQRRGRRWPAAASASGWPAMRTKARDGMAMT